MPSKCTPVNTAVQVGATDHYVCLGWCMLPLFDHHGNVAKGGKSTTPHTVRLALYEGSPRALYTLPHPTAGVWCVCVCGGGGGGGGKERGENNSQRLNNSINLTKELRGEHPLGTCMCIHTITRHCCICSKTV